MGLEDLPDLGESEIPYFIGSERLEDYKKKASIAEIAEIGVPEPYKKLVYVYGKGKDKNTKKEFILFSEMLGVQNSEDLFEFYYLDQITYKTIAKYP